jgi:hypothetical protein
VSPKERGESQRESDAPTQRQPDMASAQTQIRSELPDPLTYTTIPTLTIYRTHQHTTPNSSTRMVNSKSRSTHRKQGTDLCTPNQINKTRIVSCPIDNAHHLDCNRSFRWCVRGQIPQCSAQSDEPLNHIPYPLLSLSASQDPAPRNPAATLRDFGHGPTANQTHNESSHTDNPITPTQQICKHRPLLPLILHKSNVLLTTTRMQTNPHRSTFRYQISPTSHTSKARTP